MERSSIVIKSISCRGVKSFTFLQKSSAFVVVSIASAGDGRTKGKERRQKTSADLEGGENPEWDQTFRFDLDESEFHDLFMEFAIMAQGNLLFGERVIGRSRVPMTHLLEGHLSNVERHVSYQVHSPDGKPNGVLSFSYKLKLPGMEYQSSPQAGECLPPLAPEPFASLSGSAPWEILYPPLPLPEAESEECCCCHNSPPQPVPTEYYPPPLVPAEFYPPPPVPAEYYPPTPVPNEYYPPPPAPTGYYSPSPSPAGYHSTLSTRDAYFSSPVFRTESLPLPLPAFGTYHPSSDTGYTYRPPQNSWDYWNCR